MLERKPAILPTLALLLAPSAVASFQTMTPDEACAQVERLNRDAVKYWNSQEKRDRFGETILDVLSAAEGADDHLLTAQWREWIAREGEFSPPVRDRAYAAALRFRGAIDLRRATAVEVEAAQKLRSEYWELLRWLGELERGATVQEALADTWEIRDQPLDGMLARAELAVTLNKLRRFEKSIEMHREVHEFMDEEAPDHADRPLLLLNFAQALADRGEVWGNEIVDLHRRAISIYESRIEGDDRELAADATAMLPQAQWEFAQTLVQRNDYVRARVLATESLRRYEARDAPDPTLMLAPRAMLAWCTLEMGDYGGARRLLDENEEIILDVFPVDSEAVKRVRSNIARAMLISGKTDGVAELLELTIRDYTSGGERLVTDLAQIRINLAETLLLEGKLDEAEAALDVAEADCAGHQMFEKVCVTLRASLLRSRGLHEESVLVCERALPELLLRGTHDRAVLLLREYVLSTAALGDADRSTVALMHLLDYVERKLLDCSVLPSQPAVRLAHDLDQDLDLVWSLAGDHRGIRRRTFALMESLRGISLRSVHLRAAALRAEGGSDALREVQAMRERLSRLALSGAGESNELFALTRERDAIALEGFLSTLEDADLTPEVLTIDSIARALPARSAALTFRLWRRTTLDESGRNDKVEERMLAFVVGGKGALRTLDLGPASEISDATRRWRDAILVGEWRGVDEEGEGDESTRLRDAVLSPLAPLLEDVERVYVCLDGALHVVPVEILDPDREYRFFNTLVSLRRPRVDPPAEPRLFAVGGVDYGVYRGFEDEVPGYETAAPLDPESAPGGGQRGTNVFPFEPLGETGTELDAVLQKFGGDHAVALRGEDVTRQRFEAGVVGADFIHLATHGYYLESLRSSGDAAPAQWAETIRDYAPMVLCGLALSNANVTRNVVTAEEIASLDLEGCRLAVLSACDTYRGRPRRGHGLASLQSAMHAAGARTVLTARWKVDDEATARLMTYFYNALWNERKPAPEALRLAKERLRDRHPDYARPRYWAAWILTGHE